MQGKTQEAAAAAIDRVIHHAVILEFDVSSYRVDQAQRDDATKPSATSATKEVNRQK